MVQESRHAKIVTVISKKIMKVADSLPIIMMMMHIVKSYEIIYVMIDSEHSEINCDSLLWE